MTVVTYSPTETGRARHVTGERRGDGRVVDRLLRAGHAGGRLSDGRVGRRELRRELFVGAARDVSALDERGVAFGLDLRVLAWATAC